MKFGHQFQAALVEEGFPENWVKSAVHYRQLKKIIKKVADELSSLGLDSATLARLLPVETTTDLHGRKGSAVTSFQYEFDGRQMSHLVRDILANSCAVGGQTEFYSRITIFVENGLLINASLSPDTRKHLQNLVLQQGGTVPSSLKNNDCPSAQEYDKISESITGTSTVSWLESVTDSELLR